MTKRILALLLPALLAAAPAAPCATAGDCRCAARTPTPAEAFASADAVFRGVVMETRPAAAPGTGVRVRLRVLERWKGAASHTVTIATGQTGTNCDFYFAPAGEYVVYAHATREPGVMSVPIACVARTRLVSYAAEDLAVLRARTGAGNEKGGEDR